MIVLAAFFAFSLASCGGDDEPNCQTCTMDGADDVEICEGEGIGAGTVFSTAITAQEALGFDCN